MPTTNSIVVHDYDHPQQGFEVSPTSGTYEHLDAPADGLNPAGFGGLYSKPLGRGTNFVAIYAHESSLILHINNTVFDLSEPNVRLACLVIPLVTARLSVLRANLLQDRIWAWCDLAYDPMWGDQGRMLTYAARTASSKVHRIRAFECWSMSARGDDISSPDAMQSFEERVQARLETQA